MRYLLVLKEKTSIAVIILLSLWLVGGIWGYKKKTYATSYWLWAGITASDAPENSELYVYQGLVRSKNGHSTYERKGLYPYPIKSRKLYFSYRIEGSLPDPRFVTQTFQSTQEKWEKHSVAVNGIQLDFDSPTSRLLIYSHFLKEIRRNLPRQYELSITGLGDWIIYGDDQAMKSISENTDEIIFQLYQGRKELPDIGTYIKALSKYPLPYRVGLLVAGPENQNYIAVLRKNDNFRGVIYFIQKRA